MDQCCGSMTFWGGSGFADPCLSLNGSRSCYFRHRPSRCQQKNNFLFYYFCLYFLKVLLYLFSKIKKVKKSHKIVRIKGFLTIFAWLQKDPDPDPDPHLWLMHPDPGGSKTCGSDGSGFGSATLVETYLEPASPLLIHGLHVWGRSVLGSSGLQTELEQRLRHTNILVN